MIGYLSELRDLTMAILKIIAKLRSDRRGTSAVEYGVILAMIVFTIMLAIEGLATVTNDMWDDVSTKTADAVSGA